MKLTGLTALLWAHLLLCGCGRGGNSKEAVQPARTRISVKDYGAAGDGVTDDRAAIQRAFDVAAAARFGAEVDLPAGAYRLGPDGAADGGQLTLHHASNVSVVGVGAILYAGRPGECLALSECVRCTVRGLQIIGFCGGPLPDRTREHDSLISLSDCAWINISENYLTNCLGDCIYIGGEGLCEHIAIFRNVLKERYGNGIRSFAGGTRSRNALSVISVCDMQIDHNTVIGGMDFENNLVTELLKGISIDSNIFLSGPVQPQREIGTEYWFDEPTGIRNGSVIPQGIQATGPGFSSADKYSPMRVTNNRFEEARIEFNGRFYRVYLQQNHFDRGLVMVGDASGSNENSGYLIESNTFDGPIAGETCVIKLGGRTYDSGFVNNFASVKDGYVLEAAAGGGVDTRGNYLIGNINTSTRSRGVFSWAPARGSVYAENYYFARNRVQTVATVAMQNLKRQTGEFPTVTLTVPDQLVDYNDLTSDTIVIHRVGSGSLGGIGNAPDGAEITLQFDAAGIAVTHSARLRLRGNVDAHSSDANSILTLISRAGVMFEKCRNF